VATEEVVVAGASLCERARPIGRADAAPGITVLADAAAGRCTVAHTDLYIGRFARELNAPSPGRRGRRHPIRDPALRQIPGFRGARTRATGADPMHHRGTTNDDSQRTAP
jgi:hypothetical protein